MMDMVDAPQAVWRTTRNKKERTICEESTPDMSQRKRKKKDPG